MGSDARRSSTASTSASCSPTACSSATTRSTSSPNSASSASRSSKVPLPLPHLRLNVAAALVLLPPRPPGEGPPVRYPSLSPLILQHHSPRRAHDLACLRCDSIRQGRAIRSPLVPQPVVARTKTTHICRPAHLSARSSKLIMEYSCATCLLPHRIESSRIAYCSYIYRNCNARCFC